MKMKCLITIIALPLFLLACGNRQKGKVENAVSVIPEINIIDSLSIIKDAGEVMTDEFTGLLPAADCPGIDYTLLLTHQKSCGSGVYRQTMTYIEAEDGEDLSFTEYGRYFLLRGEGVNENASIIELIPFDTTSRVAYFLLHGPDSDSLTMLDAEKKRIESTLNYTLTKNASDTGE